ncbi:tyrosine-protein kinase ABL2-like isoform X2 [Symsagittifera roscoffensis]|uniref:tyrosine-protein kinase ABL2-like isoform X2 n=1 Tax=Symsagittifera roscoffensis TaxID=84072 RepID=UPI00307B2849
MIKKYFHRRAESDSYTTRHSKYRQLRHDSLTSSTASEDSQMISYYSHRKDGLPCCLRSVCVRPMEVNQFSDHNQKSIISPRKGRKNSHSFNEESVSESQNSKPEICKNFTNGFVENRTPPKNPSDELDSREKHQNPEENYRFSACTFEDAPIKVASSSSSSVNRPPSQSRQPSSHRASPAHPNRSSDSPYFNFTPLSMQQSTSFTGMDCLDVLENLDGGDNDVTDAKSPKQLPFEVVSTSSAGHSALSCQVPDTSSGSYLNPRSLRAVYRSEALQRVSQSTTNEDGAGVESSPRHKVNVKGTRGPGGKKVTQKYSCDGFDYTFISRLTVDDHQESSQNPNPSPNSKRDYSAEHRSENSPSPSGANHNLTFFRNASSPLEPKATSSSRTTARSSHHHHHQQHCHKKTSLPPTSISSLVQPHNSSNAEPGGDSSAQAGRRESPKSKEATPGTSAKSLEENVLENCDLYLYYQLGVGNFGVVMQGVLRNLDSGKERSVAVKILRCSEGESAESSRQQMLREAKVMSELNHPNVIKLIGIFNGPELMLVSELAPIGQLNKYLKKHKTVPVEMLMNYGLQVASGMAYLERRSFVHRDLAARNVLLATDRHARISDFGMSRMLSFNKDYYRANDGGHWPVRWYAPQCIYFFTFTSKSDVWSYGVTLWEIFSYGLRPYGNMRSSEILDMIDRGARLKCPPNCPPEMYSLMLRCWEYEEADRPTFEEIYQVVEIYFRAQASKSRDVYTGSGATTSGQN